MIQVRYYWKNEDAYILHVSKEIMSLILYPKLEQREKEKVDQYNDAFFSDDFAQRNPKLVPSGVYTIIVNKSGSIQLVEPFFPFSGMWNAYNPLKKVRKADIDSYPEIKAVIYAE